MNVNLIPIDEVIILTKQYSPQIIAKPSCFKQCKGLFKTGSKSFIHFLSNYKANGSAATDTFGMKGKDKKPPANPACRCGRSFTQTASFQFGQEQLDSIPDLLHQPSNPPHALHHFPLALTRSRC